MVETDEGVELESVAGLEGAMAGVEAVVSEDGAEDAVEAVSEAGVEEASGLAGSLSEGVEASATGLALG